MTLKYADVRPAFKKDDKTDKENYRSISILPNLSKVYERLMYDPFFNTMFSSSQCGFRKGFNAEQCLIHMVEKWRKHLDTGGHGVALLTDLSKAFDCIDHQLLIAKLNAYGVDKKSLNFLTSYLNKRKQRTKINGSYSSYHEILSGVPQGSILGPLLFNIYICDLFFDTENIDIASYADDNTPYTCSSDLDSALKKLKNYTIKIFNWFRINRLKSNAGKCNLLTSTTSPIEMQIENTFINNTNRVKLLGVHIDGSLKFDHHVTQLCKKASKKLHALSRICHYMDLNKRRTIMKAFITSQFSYCPLVWMFHSRSCEHRINSLHERSLRLVYKDNPNLTFEELLIKDNSTTIHQRNLQLLATEIFKVKQGLSTGLTDELFQFVEKPYNLRNNGSLKRKIDKTVNYGSESLSSLAPKIWELLPTSIKEETILSKFKAKIKTWTTDKCPCRLCKKYISNIGFI